MARIEKMVGCVEYTKEWEGVKLPSKFRVFDCRMDDALLDVSKTAKGRTLWSSERAEYAMGIRDDDNHADTSHPIGCQAYEDFRTCKPERLVKAIEGMVADGIKCLKGTYGNKPTLLVALGNYGWTVISPR